MNGDTFIMGLLREHILEAFNKLGIEGTEQFINTEAERIYGTETTNKMKEIYHSLISEI